MESRSGGVDVKVIRTVMKKPDSLAAKTITIQKEQPPIQLPLTFDAIVAEIIQHTGLSREEVEHRVWMEALETGWNVMRDVKRFGVTPFTFNQEMIRLYTEGDGFI